MGLVPVLRLTPSIHRQAAMLARQAGLTINAYIKDTLEKRIKTAAILWHKRGRFLKQAREEFLRIVSVFAEYAGPRSAEKFIKRVNDRGETAVLTLLK